MWFRESREWPLQLKASWLWSLSQVGSARAHSKSTLLENVSLSLLLEFQNSCDTHPWWLGDPETPGRTSLCGASYSEPGALDWWEHNSTVSVCTWTETHTLELVGGTIDTHISSMTKNLILFKMTINGAGEMAQ